MAEQQAILAGGCFWCTEAVFLDVAGVKSVESGYTGGTAVNPTYKQVCGGDTGHAEAIRITFDNEQIGYDDLLDIFFATHDPTQLNRQGPDTGTQYRSSVFPLSNAQARVTEAYIEQLDSAKVFGKKIATTIEPSKKFYPAEAYHQNFLTINPNHPYIVRNDLLKIENLKALFPDLYREEPVLVKVAG